MGALDENMARHLANIGENPQAFRDANDYYRRALVLRDAATRSGAGPAIGHITPSNLASAAEGVYGEASRAAGNNPFSELAKNGQIALGEMNSSGTSERGWVRKMMEVPGHLAGGALGFGLGSASGIHEGPLAGIWLGSAMAPVLDPIVRATLGHTVLSPAMQRVWGNQVARHASDWTDVPGLLGVAASARQAGQQ
jgi:hypothetical protein